MDEVHDQSETLLVHRLDQSPIELPRRQVLLTDRTRQEEGLCNRKRLLRYHLGGYGYVAPGRNEELVIGGSVHEGLDLLMQGGALTKAFAVAEKFYMSAPPFGDYYLPEQKLILLQDGLHLVKAFIYAFYVVYLPLLLEDYEILEVEEEINWLMGEFDEPIGGKTHLVMMSRPDFVARKRSSGKLWHGSHKTSKRLDDIQRQQLEIRIQRFSESMAIEAKYGEEVEGTLFNVFIKGDKRMDNATGVDRLVNGLIRPYLQRQGPGGEILPEMLSFVGEWEEINPDTGETVRGRVKKGFERVGIYAEMDYVQYLEWLEQSLVPRKRDYLAQAVAGMMPDYLDQDAAARWLDGAVVAEEEWAWKMHQLEGLPDEGRATAYINKHVRLEPQQCFNWQRRCSYYDLCWKRTPIQTKLDEGVLIEREPNHRQEAYDAM